MRFLICTIVAATVASAGAFAQGTGSPGVTSGPAAGTPTTLGTGGTAATPHQMDSVKNQGGAAVKNEQAGQTGGTQSTVKPGASDAGAGVHQTKP